MVLNKIMITIHLMDLRRRTNPWEEIEVKFGSCWLLSMPKFNNHNVSFHWLGSFLYGWLYGWVGKNLNSYAVNSIVQRCVLLKRDYGIIIKQHQLCQLYEDNRIKLKVIKRKKQICLSICHMLSKKIFAQIFCDGSFVCVVSFVCACPLRNLF